MTALARYRRLPTPEPSLRLIAFPLRHNWFCLPLAMARRVIPPASQAPGPGLGLTQLNQETVPIMDVADRIYQSAPLLPGHGDPATDIDHQPLQAILVVDSPRFGLLGLLIDDIPSLKRARQSAFSPIPTTYLMMNHLQGINTLVTLSDTEPPLFLLDVDALLS
ncbi:chemotaxis protein CheW [Nodosilinea sp. LEGE 06152]|uniref:chemotaxis protein CheW n=1 Tax=Nodosilinea sp. LEGE 06152 TaxID=2777966 RepID=UPI0018810120|nr:chemotaxis protein CheW [Nodosilinea sp. LEGE 06152]MBE9159451.1 chemotaxis protein CheW [Nodosilinea sp. LEGE 06152]